MTRSDFMRELESLLWDIPIEERKEALQYYNDYFEDAGEDHEQEIIAELGSPEKVANIIKEELCANAADRETKGYFTEKGYQERINNEFEIVGTAGRTQESSGTAGKGNAGSTQSTYNQYQQGAGLSQSTNQGQNTNANRSSNTGLIVLLAICTSFIWLPIAVSACGIVIGLLASIFGVVFAFGVAGVAMMGGGIAMLIYGLVKFSVPLVGALMVGGGLISLGFGMLFILTCFLLCRKVLPAVIKGFVELCRLPFKNRSVAA